MKIAHGTRDDTGAWHPDNPDEYQPLDTHGIWPWSVLDQSFKPWKDRKQYWSEQGVDDLGNRGEASPAMISTGRHGRKSGGISQFDPVLAELCLTWFCPPGGSVLDPFSGGPVRGVVATALGMDYTGIDLSRPQIQANRKRCLAATWLCADARDGLGVFDAESFDYILTCPPYHNRERYSDDPRDLSNMRWPEFTDAYGEILMTMCHRLKPDRFATVVISDVRDYRGHYRGLPYLTVGEMEFAGLHLVNEQVLVEPPGLRAKTTRVPWEACRTTTRRHQYVLTFVKGDRKKAAEAVQEC